MYSRRCTDCDLNWPHSPAYLRCGRCGKTTFVRSLDSTDIVTDDEAKSIIAHRRFEEYVEAREARKLAQFEQIISEAGYTESELEQLEIIVREHHKGDDDPPDKTRKVRA